MVPCLDMVNHAGVHANAYYDETSQDEVALLLRPDTTISSGDEVTISYGDSKSAAEMLFSYGFIDSTPSPTTSQTLVIPLNPFPDDPLAKAKLVAFKEPPKVHITLDENNSIWNSPFAYLLCVNEEDGLDFRVLQDTEGNRQLRVFWLEEDVTDRTKDFETLIQNHPTLKEILRLRAVSVVQQCLQEQLEKLASNSALDSMTAGDFPLVREECFHSALLLRGVEAEILESAVEALEEEVS